MIRVGYFIILLILYSCQNRDNEYEIINSVIRNNSEFVGMLSNENIAINDFLKVVDLPELKEYNIQYSYRKVDINKYDVLMETKNHCTIKISPPFFHFKDKNKAVVLIEKNCTISGINIERDLYFVKKVLLWWVIDKHIHSTLIS